METNVGFRVQSYIGVMLRRMENKMETIMMGVI